MIGTTTCPVCGRALAKPVDWSGMDDHVVIDCRHCGGFRLTRGAQGHILNLGLPGQRKGPVFAHAIRRMAARTRDHHPPLLTEQLANEWWNTADLPTPREQADNLILWLGEVTKAAPGTGKPVNYDEHGAIIGTSNKHDLAFVIQSLLCLGTIERENRSTQAGWRLTFDGWDRYEKLRRGASVSTTAFMAMKFRRLGHRPHFPRLLRSRRRGHRLSFDSPRR